MGATNLASDESRINEYPGAVLSDSSREIRLLTLLPGKKVDLIQCSLEHANFDQRPEIEYEALSYAWGAPDTSHTIQLNGVDFSVRENLFHALRYLRHRDASRILWIDAICINQFDVKERNHQVEQMGDIYSKASQVLAWLGLETGLSAVAFDFLRSATSFHAPNRNELKDHLGWRALEDLYERDYWKRVWIVQEVCLASRISLVCGSGQVSWKPVTRLRQARVYMFPGSLSFGEQLFMKSILARIDVQRETRQNNGCVLWTLLETFKSSQCQVIHDKVYAFLGLSNDCGSRGIPIDYSKPVKELYGDVMLFYQAKFFREDQSLAQGAQLMRLGEFLQCLLNGDSQHPDDATAREMFPDAAKTPITGQVLVAEPWARDVIEIPAHRVMLIQKFVRCEEGTKEIVKKLFANYDPNPEYRWNHRGFSAELRRGLAQLDASKVAAIAGSVTDFSCRIALWSLRHLPSGKIERPSVIIANSPTFSSPSPKACDWAVGIAPKGCQLATFAAHFWRLL